MPSNEKIIYVYDSFTFNEPKLMGKLYVNTIKGGETYSFEYDNNWLATANYPVSIALISLATVEDNTHTVNFLAYLLTHLQTVGDVF